MKTILVDAIDAFVIETENGFEIFEPMRKMLDDFQLIKSYGIRKHSVLRHPVNARGSYAPVNYASIAAYVEEQQRAWLS